jgi:hypothetical protein
MGVSGVPDDLTTGVHILHMDSMWTPEIMRFHGSNSTWTPDKVHVESKWSPSGSVA